MYRLCRDFTGNNPASLLASLAYITAPYLIVTLDARQDWTENIAQGLLPIALYYGFKAFDEGRLQQLIFAGMLWALVAMTHLITFAYSLSFFLLLNLIICWREKFSPKLLSRLAIPVGLAFLFAAWYLVPIMLYSHYLKIHSDLINPYDTNFITQLPSLFSLKAISSTPMPGPGWVADDFHPEIGLPLLLGFAICFYASTKEGLHKKLRSIIPFLICFTLAFFLVWSPLNFWKFIPHCFVILQFSYRLLTQIMWLGSILLAYALCWLFNDKIDARFFVIMLCFIALSNSSWLHDTRGGAGDTVRSLKQYAARGGDRDYKVLPQNVPPSELLPSQVPINSCEQKRKYKLCKITIRTSEKTIALPLLWYPNLLTVKANGQSAAYYPILYKNEVITGVKLAPGNYKIEAAFTGLSWANGLSLGAWLTALGLLLLISFKQTFVAL